MDIESLIRRPLSAIESQLDRNLQHRQMLVIELAEYLSQSPLDHKDQSQSLFAKKVMVAALMNTYFRVYYHNLRNDQKITRFVQFKNHVILNRNLNLKVLDLLADSFQAVLRQLGKYFLETIFEFWNEVPLFQKILILENIFVCQLPQDQLVHFFSIKILYVMESVDVLLKDSLESIASLQMNSQFLLKCLSVIFRCLNYLKNSKKQEANKYLSLILQSELHFLTFQRIMLLSYKQTTHGIVQCNFQKFEIIFFSQNKIIDKVVNSLKSACLNIQILILQFLQDPFLKQQAHQQFLSVASISKIVPGIVQRLEHYHIQGIGRRGLNTRAIKNDQSYSQVIQSSLNYIKSACGYHFINSFLIEKAPTLLFSILYPLLQLQQYEEDNFKHDSDQFIATTNFYIYQSIEDEEEDSTCTVKKAASSLLDTFTKKYQTARSLLYQVLLDMLCYQEKQKPVNLSQILSNHKIYPFREQVFLILSIVGFYIFTIPKHFQNVKHILLKTNIQKWKPIEKFRLLTFLNQFFTSVFPESYQAEDIIRQITTNMSISKPLQRQFLTFFQDNICHLGRLGQEMWTSIIKQIKKSRNADIFQCISRIINKVSCWQLPYQVVLSVLTDTCERILLQAKQFSNDSQIIYECLNLLKNIIKSKQSDKIPQNGCAQHYYISDHQKLAEHIWNFLFQLFPLVKMANIQSQSLIILKKLLDTQPRLKQKHFQYIDELMKIPFCNNIFRVYEIYVERVHQLIQKQDQQLFIGQIFGNMLWSIQQSWKKKDLEAIEGVTNIIYCLIAKHFTVISPNMHYKANQIFQICLGHLDQINNNPYCKAAFVNVLVLGQLLDKQLYQNGLNMLQQQKIVIFRDYQAKMLANNLNFIIQKAGRQISPSLTCILCKILIRLLHYQRYLINQAPNLSEQRKAIALRQQFKMKFRGIDAIDVFRQGKIGFDTVKLQIKQEDYAQIIKQIQSEDISQKELQQLISAIQIKGRYRKIIKVRKSGGGALSIDK